MNGNIMAFWSLLSGLSSNTSTLFKSRGRKQLILSERTARDEWSFILKACDRLRKHTGRVVNAILMPINKIYNDYFCLNVLRDLLNDSISKYRKN